MAVKQAVSEDIKGAVAGLALGGLKTVRLLKLLEMVLQAIETNGQSWVELVRTKKDAFFDQIDELFGQIDGQAAELAPFACIVMEVVAAAEDSAEMWQVRTSPGPTLCWLRPPGPPP